MRPHPGTRGPRRTPGPSHRSRPYDSAVDMASQPKTRPARTRRALDAIGRRLPRGWGDFLRQLALFISLRHRLRGDARPLRRRAHRRDPARRGRRVAPRRRSASGTSRRSSTGRCMRPASCSRSPTGRTCSASSRSRSRSCCGSTCGATTPGLPAQHGDHRLHDRHASATSPTRARRRGSCPTRSATASSTRWTHGSASAQGGLIAALANPYAAMPSLHTATALLVGTLGRAALPQHAGPRDLGALPGPRGVLDRGDREPLHPGCDRRRGRVLIAPCSRSRSPGLAALTVPGAPDVR